MSVILPDHAPVLDIEAARLLLDLVLSAVRHGRDIPEADREGEVCRPA